MTKQALIDLRDKVKAGDHRVEMWSALKYTRHPHIPEYARQAYIGSLDAAKAVHEAVLPGWYWSLFAGTASVFLMDAPYDGNVHYGKDANPARAWLIAILEALIAMEDTDDDQAP